MDKEFKSWKPRCIACDSERTNDDVDHDFCNECLNKYIRDTDPDNDEQC